ncbi:MAG: amino acid racemase [Gammaproteobacteria bacterium]|nr:amino acid racemase [Gammaproteobacteria bacterium]MDH3552697.1 amino acid racemase [Gammaproteobacteria bacterium]
MTRTAKIVGVLGGMGPDATVDFLAKVIALTPAEKDQDHVRMLVDHNPKVPNRQAAILSNGEDPGPALAIMAQGLQEAGADFLVVPCNTAYVFQDAMTTATTIPLISIIDVTIEAISVHCPGASKVGVLATDGCLRTGIYQVALANAGVEAILPSDEELQELMHLLNGIKGGVQDDEVALAMRQLANALVDRGAQAIIAGCTEIPLVLDATMVTVPLVSSTDALAQKTVQLARGEIPLPGED